MNISKDFCLGFLFAVVLYYFVYKIIQTLLHPECLECYEHYTPTLPGEFCGEDVVIASKKDLDELEKRVKKLEEKI